MKNPKGGRPANHAKEDLLKALLEYTKANPDQIIKLADLEKATGIKRHVWEYNLRDEIEKINQEAKREETARSGISIPSAEQILISCRGDERKLTMQIQALVDIAQDMSRYQDAEKAARAVRRGYENRLEELECIISAKDRQIDELFAQLNMLVADSENPNTRKEKGIKKNVMELTPENMEAFTERAEKLLL